MTSYSKVSNNDIKNIDTSSVEFQNALNLIQHTRQSVFLTGKAGTGKSTFLRYVCATTKKKHVILAPTGIAAINAGGSTLHSFFKLPFHPLTPDDSRYAGGRIRAFLQYNKQHIKLLRELELIVIDEISMVRADIIDFIDRILRVYTGNHRLPFGGKQMLFIGDVFQLEPVVKNDERDILLRFYPNAYFFSARVFQHFELVSIELTQVFRQRDKGLIRALDHIREGKISDLEIQLFNTRVTPYVEQEEETELNIILATKRDNVDFINQTHLDALPTDAVTIKGKIQGDFPASSLPTLMELELKEGAQIIFVKNDMEKRFVNGTLGRIEHIDTENRLISITTDEGKKVLVEPVIWANVRYTYNEREKKIEEEELGTFEQFPIRLAWAITIHKSQGLTFNNVTVDFTGGTFAGGQAYVALSRCTSLEGMTLSRAITRSDIFVRQEITQFAQHFNDEAAIERALRVAQADLEYMASIKAFDRGDMKECLDHFFVAIHSRYDIELPLQRRFIQHKLNKIGRLQRINQQLTEDMDAMQKRLLKYADEYYQMGNECITSAHNKRAAIKNYDKAIDLCPTHHEAWIRKGITLADCDETTEAMACFNEAIRLSPESFKAWYNRGCLHQTLHNFALAVSDLLKASALNPDNASCHQHLGDCYVQLDDEDTAAMHWSIAEQLRKKKEKKKKK